MKISKTLVLVALLSLLPLISIFITPDLPHTHDGAVHLPRMAAYFKALRDFHFPPRWAGDINYGYGLPLFNFIYHTPYVISSLFIALGVSLVMTFKLVMSLSFVFAGIFMYCFAKTFFKNEKAAFLVAIFYQFAPFRLVELLMRGSFGELYTYTFLPLALWSLALFFKDSRLRHVVFAAISTGLLIVSHNSISLMFFGVLGLFVFVFGPNHRLRLFGMLALLLGLFISSFYWLPAIAEHRYTYGDLFMKDTFRTHFPPLYQLILPNPLNMPSLRTSVIPTQIGIFHVLALFWAIWLILRNKNVRDRYVFIFSIIITFGALFLMSKISIPLWERIAFLRQFQFSWRLLSLMTVASAMAAVGLLSLPLFKKRLSFGILIFFVVVSTMYYWKPAEGYDKITGEGQFWNYPLNTTYFGETDVIWSAGPAQKYPPAPVEVISGSATISDFTKKTQWHSYTVIANNDARLVDHTQYFPGWRVYVDNIKVPIQFQDANWRGQITYAVPKGQHNIRVAFEETPIRIVSDVVSAATLVLAMLSLVLWPDRKLS